MPRVVLVAGELSGDRLGAGLIEAIRVKRPEVRFCGVAGPAMQTAGCEAWFSSEQLAVMGLAEVVSDLPRLRRRLLEVEQRLIADPPDLFIGIDAPDFNLRVEQRARAAGVRCLHYVSPSVWAWRPKRVRLLREACDHVLCLLPFEADFLQRHGVSATFVGHPLADELPGSLERASARQTLGVTGLGPVVAILPGSRALELERLTAPFVATAEMLARQVPTLQFVIPMASPTLRARFAPLWESASGLGHRLHLIDGQAQTAMAAADVVLLASGTATLEAMLINRPMVVAYRLAPVTYAILKMLRLVKLEYFALPNLLADERLVPEFIQSAVTPAALSGAVLHWLEDVSERTKLKQRFSDLGAVLRRNASARAAEVVLAQLSASYNR